MHLLSRVWLGLAEPRKRFFRNLLATCLNFRVCDESRTINGVMVWHLIRRDPFGLDKKVLIGQMGEESRMLCIF